MPNCPLCNQPIDYLIYNTLEVGGIVALNRNARLEFRPPTPRNHFLCPKCCDTLFDNDEDATDFLQGKTGFLTFNEATTQQDVLDAIAEVVASY